MKGIEVELDRLKQFWVWDERKMWFGPVFPVGGFQ